MGVVGALALGCGAVVVDDPGGDGDDGSPVDPPAYCALPRTGTLLWAESFGGVHSQAGGRLALDPAGGSWLTGGFEEQVELGQEVLEAETYGDLLVARLDATGHPLWGRRFGGGNDLFWGDAGSSSVAPVPGGGIVTAGGFRGSIDFGGGPFVADGANVGGFVAKLDADGNHVWSKGWVASWDVWVDAAQVDASGNVVVAGCVREGTIDLGGGPIDGPVCFVASFDPPGNHRWSRVFGGAGGTSLALDSEGNALVHMYPQVVKLDSHGNELWHVNVAVDAVWDAAVDPYGNILLAGDAVVKLDAEGHEVWRFSYKLATAWSVVADTCGDVVVAGSYSWTDFGTGEMKAVASTDIFLLKLDASGGLQWLQTGVAAGGATVAESHEQSYWDNNAAVGLALDSDDNVLVTGKFGHTIDLAGAKLVAPDPVTGWPEYDVFVAKFTR